jgi:pimeloyl-ACP methyl ester carboxylesterase
LLSITPTDLREMPHGATLEYLVTGEGQPSTAFAHGIAGGIADTRPLGSGVSGRKIFFQFRGHGRSDAPDDGLSYADLAADLRAVADEFGATRALGVSMGAGALCRLLAHTPDRFDKVVFYLPAALDEVRASAATARTHALLDAIDNDDTAAAASLLSAEIPAALRDRPAAWRYVRERLDCLSSSPRYYPTPRCTSTTSPLCCGPTARTCAPGSASSLTASPARVAPWVSHITGARSASISPTRPCASGSAR